MKLDLTLNKLKNTNFSSLYNSFMVKSELSTKQYQSLLALAICFSNATDENIKRLGYRIIVEYCNQKNEYNPLYEIAINNGLYPISKFIERNYITEGDKNFFTEWNDAFSEQYASKNIYQSEQQHSLFDFFLNNMANTVSIIAPTSYGKSELILSAIKQYNGKNICVLTSTKALLSQTKKRIKNMANISLSKIVVHPEMYNAKDTSCLAVLTQERLLRLFKNYPQLSFDCLIVDEAHELLENDNRNHTLANDIIIAQKRNPNISIKFLTPFLIDSENLKTRYTNYTIDNYKVSEYIKSEKYFLYDLRNHTGLKLYDQFLNEYINCTITDNFDYEEDVVKKYSANKNIVYLNKPTDIEKFALALADVLPDIQSELVNEACDNIANYLQPQYNLLTCLKKGIIYHHGSVPDAIRIYIEDLYKKDASIKYVISSSTLLSGVNLPAQRMFILDNRRGRSNLSSDSFKNLVGRICRFSEIFDEKNGSLQLLEPHIYIIYGRYFSQRANCEEFLKKVVRIDIKEKDNIDNVLLSNTKIDSNNSDDLLHASEFIENYEEGIIENYKERYTKTEIGKACILNGITEIDIFSIEKLLQAYIDTYRSNGQRINEPNQLLDIISTLFIKNIPANKHESLKRLENEEARKFYSMILDWRMNNKSYSEMISLFVAYWAQLYKYDNNAIIYVGKWGDTKRPGGNIAHFTRLNGKNKTEVINLAIVRIKEEQDFVDNFLIKYVEVLYDLKLIDESFYARVKYGTEDPQTICLIKNGLSLSSAVLLLKKYHDYLVVDIDNSTVSYHDNLVREMENNRENQILIYEIKSCI